MIERKLSMEGKKGRGEIENLIIQRRTLRELDPLT